MLLRSQRSPLLYMNLFFFSFLPGRFCGSLHVAHFPPFPPSSSPVFLYRSLPPFAHMHSGHCAFCPFTAPAVFKASSHLKSPFLLFFSFFFYTGHIGGCGRVEYWELHLSCGVLVSMPRRIECIKRIGVLSERANSHLLHHSVE